MRRALLLCMLLLLALPRAVLADSAPLYPVGPTLQPRVLAAAQPDASISLDTVQSVFLIFTAVVLLFIGIKWLFLWRRVSEIGRRPRPTPPPGETREPAEPGKQPPS